MIIKTYTFEFLKDKIGYLLFLTCVLLPFSFQLSTIFFVLFSVSSFLLCINEKRARIKITDILKLPSTLFFLALIGMFFSNYKDDAVNLLIKYLPYLMISVSFFVASKNLKQIAHKYIYLGVVLGVIVVNTYLFFLIFYKFSINNEANYFNIFSHKYTYNSFLRPIDSHPTYLGLLFIMSNFFVFRIKLKKGLKLAILFFNICGIFFISSKVITVLFLIQGLLFFFLIPQKKIKILILFFGIFLLIIVSFLYKNNYKDFHFLQRFTVELMWDLDPANVNTSINGRIKNDSRLARWEVIVEKAEESILFGYGSGSEMAILDEVYLKNNLLNSLSERYNTHNQYLFLIIENGIFGLMIFIYMLYLLIKEAFKKQDYVVLFYVFSVFLICFFENYFNRTMGVLASSIFLTYLRSDEKNYFNF